MLIIFNGYAMSESLPYDEIKFDRNVNLEDVIKTPMMVILKISLK